MADLAAAAFRTGPFDVSVKGFRFVFPHRTASEWMDILSRNTWPFEVTMLMEPDAYEQLLDAVQDGRLSGDDIPVIARAALSGAGGRPWWEVIRLCSAAVGGDGRLLGALVLAGADPSRITLAAFCAAVWARITENADTKDLVKAQSELVVPPPEASMEELAELDDEFIGIEQLRNMPGVRAR